MHPSWAESFSCQWCQRRRATRTRSRTWSRWRSGGRCRRRMCRHPSRGACSTCCWIAWNKIELSKVRKDSKSQFGFAYFSVWCSWVTRYCVGVSLSFSSAWIKRLLSFQNIFIFEQINIPCKYLAFKATWCSEAYLVKLLEGGLRLS